MSPAHDTAAPFGLNRTARWPGLAKLAEECGEVVQIIAKLVATGGDPEHWSGLDLRAELEKEIADVRAAADFVVLHNELSTHERQLEKFWLFVEWANKEDA